MKVEDKAKKILDAKSNIKFHLIEFGTPEWQDWRGVMAPAAEAEFLKRSGQDGEKLLKFVKECK